MDPKQVEAIYDEILTFRIELANDTTHLTQKYLNDHLATCRRYLNRVSFHLSTISREVRNLTSQLSSAETCFKVASDELLTNDARVKGGANIADRQAVINVILSDQVRGIADLKREILDLQHVEKAVKLVHNELKATNADIKSQRQLMRDELDTGAFYGDERMEDGTRKKTVNERELDELFAEVEAAEKANVEAAALIEKAEVPAPAAVETKSSEEAPKMRIADEAGVIDPEMIEFLGRPATPAAEDDYDDIFKSLGSV